ncbi:MAG: hypothetical protein NTY67_08890 [Cyanobacteria bacterium]|nr:hypothetical protein [Cyanobacteriota bacterium]
MRPLPLVLSGLALLPLTGGSASASLPAIGSESARSASSDEASKAVVPSSSEAHDWQASGTSVADDADPASPAAAPLASPAAGLQLAIEPLERITGQPPAPESAAARDDLAVLNWLQPHRTPQMVATT